MIAATDAASSTCAGCGMHLLSGTRARSARPPESTLDVPVCSSTCQASVERFGTLPGWHP